MNLCQRNAAWPKPVDLLDMQKAIHDSGNALKELARQIADHIRQCRAAKSHGELEKKAAG